MPPKDTLNTNYLKFKESLPENLRLTPEKDYHMYDYWRLSGEPENFTEGKQRGMFTWDKSDKGYHAGSIAEDRNTGIYHFMKPKHHPTVKYELDWFNKGLKTLEGGKQVPVEGKDKEFWEDFTSKYQLDTTGVDYRYVPIKKKGGSIHIKKKNRGKFTDYCGGKVTQECIEKGKKSTNPTIRKRATFADNARKWKHQEGGVLNKVVDNVGSMTNPLGHILNAIHKVPFLQPYTKQVVNKINEYGEELVPKMWGFNEGRNARLKSAKMWQNGERFGKNFKEHSDYVFNQEKEKYKENPKMIPRSQRAAKIAVLGSLLGGYGELLSIPDQIYDWSASIDDPNIRNNAHTASNYLSELAHLTPTKYDDYIAPIGEAIGNIDDMLSGAGYDLFGLRKSKRQE